MLPETKPYYEAWLDLADDRLAFSHALGMAGSMLLHQRIGRDVIRREGKRLGYSGEALETFVWIVRSIDRFDRSENVKRQAKDIDAAMKKNAANNPPRQRP